MRRGGPGAPGGFAPPSTSAPRVVITVPEGTFELGLLDLGDLEREMEAQMAAQAAALREMEAAQNEWTHANDEEIREHLRLVEQQAEAFRLEAERARRKAEREVRTRLAPPAPAAGPGRSPSRPSCPRRRPCLHSRRRPGRPPADASTSDVPCRPSRRSSPPWRFWFDARTTPTAEARSGRCRRGRGRRARARGGRARGLRRPLASLRPEDFVTVAVDLVPDVLLRRGRARTLLVRVRARRSPGAARRPPHRRRASASGVEFEEN